MIIEKIIHKLSKKSRIFNNGGPFFRMSLLPSGGLVRLCKLPEATAPFYKILWGTKPKRKNAEIINIEDFAGKFHETGGAFF